MPPRAPVRENARELVSGGRQPAAAQRKQADAEREALGLRGELEELRDRFEIVKAEADALNELNARVEKAKHVGDLFS